MELAGHLVQMAKKDPKETKGMQELTASVAPRAKLEYKDSGDPLEFPDHLGPKEVKATEETLVAKVYKDPQEMMAPLEGQEIQAARAMLGTRVWQENKDREERMAARDLVGPLVPLDPLEPRDRPALLEAMV